MAQFSIAIALTLQHEGGYTNNSADPGGATNMGITQRDMPNINIRDLTVVQAEAFYLKKFWNSLYDNILDQLVANKIFDMTVLFGIVGAIHALQGILNITTDGSFGPATLSAVNNAGPYLLNFYKKEMISIAQEIVEKHPTEQQFLIGWTRRINS